jgi:hypothetical protein
VCRFSFSYFWQCQWRLSVGTLGFWELDSVLEPVAGVELPKVVFASRARWMPLIVKWNASANMFYVLKHLLLLILVVFKLKCNNFIFNEIIVLNASYVCLHAFSLCRESLDLDLGRRTPHFWGATVTWTVEGNWRWPAATLPCSWRRWRWPARVGLPWRSVAPNSTGFWLKRRGDHDDSYWRRKTMGDHA